jgi:hypothetical protein
MSANRLTIRVNPTIRKQLAALAKRTGRNQSDLARRALEAFLTNQQKGTNCLELFRKHRLIGSGRSRPPIDLSTNKTHFEGFGR